MVQLSHPYMTTGKTIAFTIPTFVSKVISLLFNTLSRIVMALLPRKWKVKFTQSCLTLCDPWTYTVQWNSPGQNTGVGSRSLLQGIFPTQGSSTGLLPRSSHLISRLQSPSTVILESKKRKSVTTSTFSPSVCHEVVGPDAMILVVFF